MTDTAVVDEQFCAYDYAVAINDDNKYDTHLAWVTNNE